MVWWDTGFFTRDALYTWMDSSNTPYDDLYFPKNRVRARLTSPDPSPFL